MVTAYLIEMATGQARAHLQFKTYGLGWYSGTLVTDGRFLAYADTNHFSQNPIRAWDFATGREVGRCQPAANVTCLALTLDARTLAAGLADGTAMVWQRPASGRVSGTPLSESELDQAWKALAAPAAPKAFAAMCRLTADPDYAVPFLRAHVRAVAPPKADRVQQLITDLDSDDFGTREKASQALASMGPAANPALERARAANPSPEVRRRVEKLLKKRQPKPSADALRARRAVETLERIGSPAARQVLETLAEGDPVAPLTREAQASLRRERGH